MIYSDVSVPSSAASLTVSCVVGSGQYWQLSLTVICCDVGVQYLTMTAAHDSCYVLECDRQALTMTGLCLNGGELAVIASVTFNLELL